MRKDEWTPPSAHDWRTTDLDEINKRRQRAREESFAITNLEPVHRFYSNFHVESASGLTYSVEVRDLERRHVSCDCVDFRINGLGTCKHAEAVLLHLQARFKHQFAKAKEEGSRRVEFVLDPVQDTLRLLSAAKGLPRSIKDEFGGDGLLRNGSAESTVSALRRLKERGRDEIRISQEVEGWLENRRRVEERKRLRHEYELKVQQGEWPAQETKVPLFPYQREGMLHLAFTERALLADEMGLGKTIQAIAACALLHRLGLAKRALVVTPASLKTEWEEQIQRFTDLPYQLVFGPPRAREQAYTQAPFFTIVNYEQMLADSLKVNGSLQPDIVVLDEAQRIKNWSTKTARAVKRLRSRYAFVLTGTPIENRIDELHSLMDFLNPSVLGPLFRFNRDFYELDDRGRPCGYHNLEQLHERIKPYMIRRRKADVETELPGRTDRQHFVPLSDGQKDAYAFHEKQVARLMQIAKRRPLTKQEQDKLMRELAMMRMVCDTNYILNADDRACPKLAELEKVAEACRDNGTKMIVFSEWERMLDLVRDLCRKMKLGFAWHTGSVPQQRRRGEINAFKNDPNCLVFLSTDSGSTGLNLQNASVVVNCDLPWNPAKLEQRIARAWRKNQKERVTVVNLVSENTIEHRMLDTLASKQALADGVLDLQGDLSRITMRRGQQAFLEKLEQLMGSAVRHAQTSGNGKPALPADRGLAFAHLAHDRINGALVRCEEQYPDEGSHSVLMVVVDADPARYRPQLESLHRDLFGPGQGDPLAPVQLEVIDRATDETLRRLMDAGLITSATRWRRPLATANTDGEPAVSPPPLSAEEQSRMDGHFAQAERLLKMARLLSQGGFESEARKPALEALDALGRAKAGAKRLSEPREESDWLRAPWNELWEGEQSVVRGFMEHADRSCVSFAESLERLMPHAAPK